MKKLMKFGSIIMMVAMFATFFTSCEDEILPIANFTVSSDNIIQYDEVTFASTSTDAVSYSWIVNSEELSTESTCTVTFLTAGTVTVQLTVTNEDGDDVMEQTITVTAPDNHYMLDDVKFAVSTEFFWYTAMSSTYLRLLSDPIDGQDNPDLIKLYPNMGLGELPGTYTWDNVDKLEGTYTYGYTANYAGMSYDWTALSVDGSSDLEIVEVDTDVYKITGTMILSCGNYNADWTAFVEESQKALTISYIGGITPAGK